MFKFVSVKNSISILCVALLIVIGCTPQREASTVRERTSITTDSQPLLNRDYSFAWWPNGFRKEKTDESTEVFCVESGHYAFTLDIADFSKSRFGRIHGPGYLAALGTGAKLLAGLSAADLKIELEHQGKVYRAVDCLAGRQRNPRHAIMLESGRFVQRYRFMGLQFQDETGKVLETNSTLEIVAWPSSLTLSLETAPDHSYENGPCPGITGAGRSFRAQPMDVPHDAKLDPGQFTLEAWVRIPERLAALNGFHWLIGKNSNEWVEGNFGLMLNSETVTAITNVGGGRENVYRADKHHALTAGVWHHLAMSYDDESLRLYVDGRPAASSKVGKVRKPGNGKLRIGGRPDGHGKPVHALFDELRIWSRALSSNEITAHAKSPDQFSEEGLSWRESFDEDGKPGETFSASSLEDAVLRVSLKDWSIEKKIPGKWEFDVKKKLVLHCPLGEEAWRNAPIEIAARGSKGVEYKVGFAEGVGAVVVDVPKFERDWKTGYTDIRDYDEVEIRIDNKSADRHNITVLFDIKNPANITGMTPILCDAQERPTGVPIQLSKNWHHGTYAKLYAILPVAPGQTEYRLRIAYGFWGKLPAASHAQLSLFGYGGNGRWDQLAIGCWGETMCLDMDNSLTTMMVTDVRMLMARNGKDGRMWGWTDGGWGGDWLGVTRADNDKLLPVELKTAYLAHGPCLTDVRYSGSYGKDRDVGFKARVATLRTDDHNRVFQQFRYQFKRNLSAAGSYFFKMGPTGQLLTPRIAYGNRDGLIAEHDVPGRAGSQPALLGADKEPAGSRRAQGIALTGEGPWWVAFPGSFFDSTKDWGTGSRALIIRSFKTVLGGKTYGNPVVAFPVHWVDKAMKLAGLNMEMVTPPGVTHFKPGDTIEMDVEWITVPRVADDYYGPNETFRSHLQEHPKSWKTVYREAIGNDLEVSVRGGKLLHRYPVVIAANKLEVEVTIKGGVGAVPIRFEGLRTVDGCALHRFQDGQRVPLDQSVHGNDFWQTDYDADSGTYKMSFNLVLEDAVETTWILTQKK